MTGSGQDRFTIEWIAPERVATDHAALHDARLSLARMRVLKAECGERQYCATCGGDISALHELGGIIIAHRPDADGKGGSSTSRAVCEACASRPRAEALRQARDGLAAGTAFLDWLTRGADA
jgi:hypothetical protein